VDDDVVFTPAELAIFNEAIDESIELRKRRARQDRASARIARRATQAVPPRPANHWGELETRLAKGAAFKGTKLSPAECRMLGEIMRGLSKRPRGRPCDPVVEARARRVAALTTLFELDGEQIKAAVEEAAALFGVGRSIVYDARKQFGALFSGLLLRATPKVRDVVFQRIMMDAVVRG
jgi:hypothetical protein